MSFPTMSIFFFLSIFASTFVNADSLALNQEDMKLISEKMIAQLRPCLRKGEQLRLADIKNKTAGFIDKSSFRDAFKKALGPLKQNSISIDIEIRSSSSKRGSKVLSRYLFVPRSKDRHLEACLSPLSLEKQNESSSEMVEPIVDAQNNAKRDLPSVIVAVGDSQSCRVGWMNDFENQATQTDPLPVVTTKHKIKEEERRGLTFRDVQNRRVSLVGDPKHIGFFDVGSDEYIDYRKTIENERTLDAHGLSLSTHFCRGTGEKCFSLVNKESLVPGGSSPTYHNFKVSELDFFPSLIKPQTASDDGRFVSLTDDTRSSGSHILEPEWREITLDLLNNEVVEFEFDDEAPGEVQRVGLGKFSPRSYKKVFHQQRVRGSQVTNEYFVVDLDERKSIGKVKTTPDDGTIEQVSWVSEHHLMISGNTPEDCLKDIPEEAHSYRYFTKILDTRSMEFTCEIKSRGRFIALPKRNLFAYGRSRQLDVYNSQCQLAKTYSLPFRGDRKVSWYYDWRNPWDAEKKYPFLSAQETFVEASGNQQFLLFRLRGKKGLSSVLELNTGKFFEFSNSVETPQWGRINAHMLNSGAVEFSYTMKDYNIRELDSRLKRPGYPTDQVWREYWQPRIDPKNEELFFRIMGLTRYNSRTYLRNGSD